VGVAFCLRFDDVTTAAVRRIWDELASRGISSDMIEAGYPPHLTLPLTDDMASPTGAADLLGVVTGVPAKIVLGEPRVFAGTEVVYLSCETTPDLVALHSQLASAFPADRIHEYYRLGMWTPHVGLQLKGDVERSLAVARRLWRATAATPAHLDLVTFPPIAVVQTVKVGGT
jgi:hypothetical protein